MGTRPAAVPREAVMAHRRRRLAAVATTFVALVVLAGCEPSTPVPGPPVAADRDTFTASNHPTERRGEEPVLRLVTSSEKTKVGYLSFPVTARGPVDGVLRIQPLDDGGRIEVRSVGAFTEATTHVDRPALGPVVGELARSRAGVVQEVALRDVPVTGGRVDLALATTGATELEVVSTEGAAAAGQPAAAPRFVPDGVATTPTAPSPTSPTPTTRPGTAPPGWRLSFADEFDGTQVDEDLWRVYDEANGDAVESPKTTTCPKASNVRVSGGILTMRTQKAGGACAGGQAQSGAGMNTWGSFTQAGGRFEVRGRWTHAGNYLWGGFWTAQLGKVGSDPSEIDTWEYIGRDAEPNRSRYRPAIHYNYTCEGTCGTQAVTHSGYDVTQWHTYAVEWEPTVPSDPSTMEIRFLLDGRLIAVFDRSGSWSVTTSGTRVLQTSGAWRNPARAFPNPFGLDRRHHLILSAWVGAPGTDAATVAAGYRPSGGHADLQIDYVRVYAR